jgi:K+-transporting ATPase ATPase C chain
MRALLRPVLVLLLSSTLITGIAYPLAVLGLAQAIFPWQANGSLLIRGGRVVGSELIGQPFDDPQYFWGRPSATIPSPYNAYDPQTHTGSAGSNLGPVSEALQTRVRMRIDALRRADPGNAMPIPVDLVTASASGLDPDISVAAALYQVPRVAHARGMNPSDLRDLVLRHIAGRQLGILGEPRVNVLELNLALDVVQ